jgi:hypothetical protein
VNAAEIDERRAVLMLSGDWQAGPDLDDGVLAYLGTLQSTGLAERAFGDMGAPSTTADEDGIRVRLSACWWFRLTAAGLQVRAALASASHVASQIEERENG